MVAIAATNLVKRYQDKLAVNDVSLDIGEDELLVLVGPSGCGKTTTLRMLVGLEPITSGTLRFGEKVVNEIRPKDRNVAMVFQDYAIFPHFTVYENIAYGMRARHENRALISERVPAAARMFRIDHLLKRKPRQLSGGERQRVALARALVRDASLYLYDEPLANLDAQLRHQAREDILLLHREKGRPSVYVTHDQSEAMALGDRIAVMRDGKIQQIGTGTELYDQPYSRFVAFFIGTPSINLFDAELRNNNGEIDIVTQAFTVRAADEMKEKIRGHIGRPVTLGLRPEDLHPPRNAPFPVTAENTIHGIVNVIEPTSTGCTVYLTTLGAEGQDFIATFKARLPASYIGKEVPLAVNRRKIQLFDAETERSLLYGPGIQF
ncbi:ABC transporter ATP-binding protein [Tengunoibacter tsumagoiensis]|uniref:Glycerol-3-phosphate ABC transporter ATP-binding protein n=1 Tax=Tengunoibacter tsumagoiensis TaxID=2014871 RepID=A0A402A3Q7_9CHLR|nr:ABC transporter ATP-binding protein [Tengunoibacter tsumagoiensis]GCE13780.1 glycerol-3-phosphate ABC transporter ATP-binding protein [Tengunoibacter tsumagoiensis]